MNPLNIKKDFSKVDKMLLSRDWNTFYTAVLMKSELSLKDPTLIRTKIKPRTRLFSRIQLSELDIIVGREAQIQMHIWYSIIKDNTLLKEFTDDFKTIIKQRAKQNWGTIVKITQELNSSENLILSGFLKSQELKEYGKTQEGLKAIRIKQDHYNRFVYVPTLVKTIENETERVERKIDIIDCMFHYDDIIDFSKAKNDTQRTNLLIQAILSSNYIHLSLTLPDKIDTISFRSVIKENYLLELFKGNSKLINL